MIFFDARNRQILSPLCAQCSDPDFKPRNHNLFNAGCCGHSPVFTLFEIGQMVRKQRQEFFLRHIYRHENSVVRPYDIVVRARVHPRFYGHDTRSLTDMERADLEREYSLCPFFVEETGCGLDPQFKPSLCRAFICTDLESRLDEKNRTLWQKQLKEIRAEAENFNKKHRAVLQHKKLNLIDHVGEVLAYFERMFA